MAYVLQVKVIEDDKKVWRTLPGFYETESHARAVIAQMESPSNWRVMDIWDIPQIDPARAMIAHWRASH